MAFRQTQMETAALRPADYWSQETFDREQETIFANHWHCVGPASQWSGAGSNLAVELGGIPVVIRREAGELVAFRNVCPHRHSLIVPPGPGRSDTLRCQYHGWEFDRTGRLSHLPDGPSFKGFKAKNACLQGYRVDTHTGLVFVNLGTDPVSLAEYLGPLGERMRTNLGSHSHAWTRSVEYACNWKVVVENSLEGYHSAVVHPNTFGASPDEPFVEHEMGDRFAAYRYVTDVTTLQKYYQLGLRTLSMPTATFRTHVQAAIYPNYMIDYSGINFLFSNVEPLARDRTRFTWHAFLPESVRRGIAGRMLREVMGARFDRAVSAIFAEDMSVWSAVQRGLESATDRATIGRREERVHHFQTWVAAQLAR